MVLPANAIAEALELSMNELVFDGRAPRSSSSFIFLSAFLTFLALLTTFTTVDSGRQCCELLISWRVWGLGALSCRNESVYCLYPAPRASLTPLPPKRAKTLTTRSLRALSSAS